MNTSRLTYVRVIFGMSAFLKALIAAVVFAQY
ncbi:hypothetical protein EDF67_103445 [Sphingobacterium sp. JUb78]|nr:hypothetical protein [Sphingobacterium sp. JUb56]MCS3556839.1 hypothetical protein [Sphingobacterium sp. JUb21]MCW2262980.1 hypothetical protein [Sphingobacterium kitahiroshimense]TCR12029.1 hypothetical protein EDF67_103445 [Sphingobacterium sp. JUb78]